MTLIKQCNFAKLDFLLMALIFFLCLSNSIKKLNKLVNANLKDLVNCLKANKILLNIN